MAAYDPDGQRLWQKTCFPGDVYTMATADLDEDGKAEALVYLTSDELHRVNGDGSERPVGDTYQAQLDAFEQRAGFGSVTTLGAWGPDDVKNKEVARTASPAWPWGRSPASTASAPAASRRGGSPWSRWPSPARAERTATASTRSTAAARSTCWSSSESRVIAFLGSSFFSGLLLYSRPPGVDSSVRRCRWLFSVRGS